MLGAAINQPDTAGIRGCAHTLATTMQLDIAGESVFNLYLTCFYIGDACVVPDRSVDRLT